jgi:hypothetical protein
MMPLRFVMAELVAATHVFDSHEIVNARDKRGHDVVGWSTHAAL